MSQSPATQLNTAHRTTQRNCSACLKEHHHHFTAPFLGPSGWASARSELLDFMVQGKMNRGRHTDHPAGHHFIQTNQYPPPPSPHFLQAGCPSCHLTNSDKALKALALKNSSFETNYIGHDLTSTLLVSAVLLRCDIYTHAANWVLIYWNLSIQMVLNIVIFVTGFPYLLHISVYHCWVCWSSV